MSDYQNGVPQFDFSELSWGDDKRGTEIAYMIRAAQKDNDIDLLREALNAQDQYLAKVVRYVPREWLVSSAPDNIDWTQAESMNYVLASKFDELRSEMMKAKAGN